MHKNIVSCCPILSFASLAYNQFPPTAKSKLQKTWLPILQTTAYQDIAKLSIKTTVQCYFKNLCVNRTQFTMNRGLNLSPWQQKETLNCFNSYSKIDQIATNAFFSCVDKKEQSYV